MRFLLLPFILSLASCAAIEPGPNDKPVRLSDPQLTEASGLAVSRRDPKLLWLVNDSGSPPSIHLAGTNGSARGIITLRKVKNTDWEDLAAFTLNGKPYLLVADNGDNEARRDEVTLHIVAEPKAPASDTPLTISVTPDWSIRFRYEDGPRDCEGVAVDPVGGHILLVSKRDKQPAIYQLPLRKTSANEVLTAKRLGLLAPIKLPPKTLPHPYHTQPTSLDLSPDGRTAAVLSYRGVYLFRRTTDESWAQAFARPPEILGGHGLSQAEALAFSLDGRVIHVTSEGKHPRLVSMPVPTSTIKD